MLITKILNNHYTPARRWSTRKNSMLYLKLKEKIRNFLNLLSGFEIATMLKNVLTKDELYDISKIFVDSLKGIAENVNKNIKLKQKHKFIRPLRIAGFSNNDIKKLGFKCGKLLWKNCLIHNERLVGGRPNLNDDIQNKIEEHLEINSSFGANRVISERVVGPYLPIAGKFNGLKKPKPKRLIEKNIIPVRYIYLTRLELTKIFNEKFEQDLNKKMSYSTLTKYIHKKYKKARRFTDLCPYCENGKKLKNDVTSLLAQFNHEQSLLNVETFDTKTLLTLFTQNLKDPNYTNQQKNVFKSILSKLYDLNEIEIHRQIGNRQKNTYNQMIKNTNLLKDSIIIELDYKQKIVYGLAPRATNEQFYKQKQASCLGFGIYYFKDEKIMCLNIDIISDCLEQDANAVIRAYEYVRKLDIFEKNFRNIQDYIIWSDCGTQFRCKELNYYYFTTLAEQNIRVNCNYFGEKHGKFSRDQHFSVISYYIRRESIKTWIKSSEDIAEIINSSQKSANFYRTEQNKDEIVTKAYVLNPTAKKKFIKHTREIQNLTCFYNLQNVLIDGRYYLNSTVYSDLNKYIDAKYLDSKTSDENAIINFKNSENIAVEEELNIEGYLKQKRQKIEMFLSSASNHPSPSKIINSNDRNIQLRLPIFEINVTTIQKPNYCSNSCQSCSARIEYTIEQLNIKNASRNLIGQVQINNELSNHSHPKSRKIKGTFRTTEQARMELIDHYKFAHNLEQKD